MGSFNEKVWKLLSRIPSGKITTYQQLAKAAGSPKAFRAAGNACNANPNSPKVPCHRVVSANGFMGGYAHGPKAKKRLLESEGIRFKGERIEEFEKKLFRF
ncbi:MAG: MGMT family protein [Candidatus Diapherotrites archaeon]|nr:MGMT family protein [Candidatus Diapherotrites archaeon]